MCTECGNPQDYHLHLPASACKPCYGPRDHHQFKPDQRFTAVLRFHERGVSADSICHGGDFPHVVTSRCHTGTFRERTVRFTLED